MFVAHIFMYVADVAAVSIIYFLTDYGLIFKHNLLLNFSYNQTSMKTVNLIYTYEFEVYSFEIGGIGCAPSIPNVHEQR